MAADGDIIVLGSGLAGLTAALAATVDGAKVSVYEKADLLGGTTTLSAGVIWIPNNQLAIEAGIDDSRDKALQYLESLSNGKMLPELTAALVDGGPRFLDFLERNSRLRLQLVHGYPDYNPEHPGGLARGGRSVEAELVSFEGLGEWTDRIGGDVRRMLCREIPMGGGTGVLPADVLAERTTANLEGLGRGLIGGLLRACLERGVQIHTGARAIGLVEDKGEVSGVEIAGSDGVLAHSARGVILATGGFEHDPALVRDFLRGPLTHPIGVPSDVGDGLKMAMKIGAQLGNMSEAWWSPVVNFPGRRRDGGENALLSARERALPGCIMVNRRAVRFCNEAANYNSLGGAFHRLDESTLEYSNVPAWMLFDQSTVDRFGVFGYEEGAPVPEWATRAGTIAELALRIGLPADQLTATIDRFNHNARAGIDPDFSRGMSAYDRWPSHFTADGPDSPFASLGPLETGPFYAAEVAISSLGTKGGPRTDVDGRVLNVDGNVIRGLYAAGNVMASPAGMAYGGAGATLAVAGIWGMLAGRAAARDLSFARN